MSLWHSLSIEEKRAVIVKGVSEGLFTSQIASRFPDCNRNMIIGWAHRHDVDLLPPKTANALRRLGVTKKRRPAAPRPKSPKKPVEAPRMVPAPNPAPVLLMRPVHFLDRRTNQCAWPLWDGDEPLTEKRCCGAKVLPGLSYCHGHFIVSCGPGTPSERRASRVEAA